MFKSELQDQIDKRLKEFIDVELGNRITHNNWNWLMLSLGSIFKQNKLPEEHEA